MCGKVKSLNLIRHYIILHLLQYLINVIKHKNPRTTTNEECPSKIIYTLKNDYSSLINFTASS